MMSNICKCVPVGSILRKYFKRQRFQKAFASVLICSLLLVFLLQHPYQYQRPTTGRTSSCPTSLNITRPHPRPRQSTSSSTTTRCSNLGSRDVIRALFPSTNETESPLQPITSLHTAIAMQKPDVFINQWQALLSEGRGLIPCVTDDGEEILWENGVEYRKYPYREILGSPIWSSEYEPHVPFSPDLFFLGDDNKIEAYNEMVKKAKNSDQSVESQNRKVILWWQDKDTAVPMPCPQPLRMCTDLPCLITSNRAFKNTSHAMLINGMYARVCVCVCLCVYLSFGLLLDDILKEHLK